MRRCLQGESEPRAAAGGPVWAALAALLLVLSIPVPALGQVDPYGTDPLGIVAHADRGRTYSQGQDVWEVIVCRVPDGGVAVTPDEAASIFSSRITPYFTWLSGGSYVPAFRAGASVVSPVSSNWPDDPFARQFDCEQRARSASSRTAEGAIVVVDAPYEGGYGTIGFVCGQASTCPGTYPDNRRVVVVGSGTVVAGGGVATPRLMTVAHEMGHGIALPHSFGGLTRFENGELVWEYDNPMDIMSGGELVDLEVGTLAINRYAAGWIRSMDLAFHRGGTATYRLSAPGLPGVQLLVLPTDARGVYEVVAPRRRADYDSGIPVEGVEVYRVDQRGSACGLAASEVCWGPDRRTQQIPPVDDPQGTAHVHPVGSVFQVRTASVEVVSAEDGVFTVRVAGQVVSQRFVDDDGSVHEPDIAAIAEAGITVGCNPPLNSWYCPSSPVTRAEMAAFLLRAIGDPGVPQGGGRGFADVPDGQWYTSWVRRLAELGITTGYADGTYRPAAPVSRAEMAVFLTRALPGLDPAPSTGRFVDVPASAWYAAAVEGIAAAGVTVGCSDVPLAYCPHDAVRRDQMASFLARAG